MMAVAAGLLVPLLWDSLLKLALGTGLLTALGGAAVALERRAGSRALRASQTQTQTIPQSAE
jgi:DHA1 family bicyclomycin/chloramphenicol resistance-like MFS transporter